MQMNWDEMPQIPTFLMIKPSPLSPCGLVRMCRLFRYRTIIGVTKVLTRAMTLPDALAIVIEVNEKPTASK